MTKNSLPIISLFTANAISLVGNVLSAIAIPWFVLQTTGSATQTGITGFFTVALIPLLYFTIGLEFWQLMALVFLGALLDSPGSTARNALVPELAELAQIPLERATSLIHIIERSARLIGAPLSGLLIAWVGTENVLWIDAASAQAHSIPSSVLWNLSASLKTCVEGLAERSAREPGPLCRWACWLGVC